MQCVIDWVLGQIVTDAKGKPMAWYNDVLAMDWCEHNREFCENCFITKIPMEGDEDHWLCNWAVQDSEPATREPADEMAPWLNERETAIQTRLADYRYDKEQQALQGHICQGMSEEEFDEYLADHCEMFRDSLRQLSDEELLGK
jgi:hypothetical protein